MKNILKKLWTELTRIREFEFISYETTEEEDARLSYEFNERKQEILTENYRNLMHERLIPFCRDLELTKSGLLLSDSQLFEKAHAMFLQAKEDGKLDELNSIVRGCV